MTANAGPRELRRLLTAVMAVAYEGDVASVLEHTVIAAREMVGARYAALGVLDPSRTFLAQFITVGIDDDQRARIGEPPKGHGLLGVLIADPNPIRLPDLSEHPDSFGFPLHHPPMKSFLGVPLYVQGEVFGNLYLADKDDEDGFSDIDEELAQSLAAAAALTIDNTRFPRASRGAVTHRGPRAHRARPARHRAAGALRDRAVDAGHRPPGRSSS